MVVVCQIGMVVVQDAAVICGIGADEADEQGINKGSVEEAVCCSTASRAAGGCRGGHRGAPTAAGRSRRCSRECINKGSVRSHGGM